MKKGKEWKKERRVEEGKKSGRRKEERVKRERKWSEAERWSVRESRVRGIERKKEKERAKASTSEHYKAQVANSRVYQPNPAPLRDRP